MPNTLAALLLAHVLADYVFQTKYMVENKSKAGVMLWHIFTVWAMAALCLGTIGESSGYWPLALLAGLHLIIDMVKTHAERHGLTQTQFTPYVADQLAHILSVFAIAALTPALWSQGVWAGPWFDTTDWLPSAMILLAGAIYVTRAGGFAVGALMAPMAKELGDKLQSSVPNGGAHIGHLERGLIYLLILAGQPGGIGFLIAAKSVLRFDANSDNARAEYVIIGTLASFGWAIAVSIATLALVNVLNDLPILEIIAPKP